MSDTPTPAPKAQPLSSSLKYTVHTSLHSVSVAVRLEHARLVNDSASPIASLNLLQHAIDMADEALHRLSSLTSAVEAYERLHGPITRGN